MRAHEGEHGFSGDEKFGFGYVADDLVAPMPLGRTKERMPLRFFLSRLVKATSFCAVALKAGEWAVAEDEICKLVGIFFGDGLAGAGYVERGDHAPADGFAVQELLVVGGGFDGVADGVAEVQDHAQAGLFFVVADDVGFDADAGGDDVGRGLWGRAARMASAFCSMKRKSFAS